MCAFPLRRYPPCPLLVVRLLRYLDRMILSLSWLRAASLRLS